jgi:hypothetical protein
MRTSRTTYGFSLLIMRRSRSHSWAGGKVLENAGEAIQGATAELSKAAK